MKKTVLIFVVALAACSGGGAQKPVGWKPDGKTVFNNLAKGGCSNCHKTTDQKLVGPGLAGVGKKYSAAWLKKWIANPQKTWEENDPETRSMKTALGAENRPATGMKLLHPLEEAEIDALVAYLLTL